MMKQKNSRQYKSLSSYLQEAREEERKTIAREIHDELGQLLTAMKIQLSLLPEEIKNDATAALERTEAMKKQIDGAIATVKNIITKLRPGLLDDLGLAAAIEWQAHEFQMRTGVVCDVKLTSDKISLEQEVSTAVFRILQETLTNVARHAKATRVQIELVQQTSTLLLTIRDNGKGITDEEIHHPESFGLIGIRERVSSFNGDLEICGTPNKGTTIRVSIPLNIEP